MVSPNRFRFLNKEHELHFPESWNDPNLEKLWIYNLHYFDDLNAGGAEERRSWHEKLIERWITENPPPKGNGWEPYPLSLRVVNWIKWALAGNELSQEAIWSLAVQVRYLSKRMEWHLLGNHLFANAKALVFAGLFFQGREAQEWLSKGLKALSQQIREQILPDGGHFERSPMYHSIILDDLLDLYNLSVVYGQEFPAHWRHLPDTWRDCIHKMRFWLKVMTHPDGEIALFNDAAWKIAPEPSELESYSRRLELDPVDSPSEGITHLMETGYIRLQKGPVVAFLDVGKIGPDYLPGHAHADTLTFEMSLFGSRVIVNSGTSCYGQSEERLRQRSTSAHNTLEVDGNDSSEVWGGFRVARRAYPFGLNIEENEKELMVTCAHDGYRRLPGRVVHRRTWRLTERDLEIIDYVDGRTSRVVGQFYLHPEVLPIEGKDFNQESTLHFKDHSLRWTSQCETRKIQQSTYHPEFGVSLSNNYLMFQMNGRTCSNRFSWD